MSETTLKARLVHPCKTDAEWASSNPVAKKGEIMISSDKSGMFKVGNGTSKWSELGYNHVTWANVEGKPSTYPATAHTHDDRYYTESEIDGKLAKYLPKSGGTMEGTAFISWPDTGNWSNSNTGVTFPVSRGGLQWSGQSDGIQLYAVETGNDNLELYLKFLDDNSNGLSIRNAKGNETARISASGVISASSFIGTLTGDITGHAYGVRDYNNSKNIIQIGYSGDGLTTANLSHIAGYTDNGTKIKDVSKEVLRSWIGLGSAAYTNSDSYAPSSHTHDDRYYTETEINDKVTALNNSIATKVTEKTITTATDFNTFTTTGIYHICVSTNSNLHAPTTNHGTLIVDFSVGTPYQIWIPDNNMTAQYKRTYSSSTWSGWTTQKLTDTVYTHPSYTAYTSGLYKITTNSLGHVTSATAVTKGDITALGIPGSNTDSKVLQTAVKSSDYTNWRTVLWGASNSGTEGFTPTTVTDSVFSSQTLTFQPSTGTLKANTFKGNLSGNATSATSATTATKLATARTISLTGSVTGSGSFDGSGNLSITTSTNHTHSYSSLTGTPTIGNGTITIKQNGTKKATFTMNQTGNTTVELTDTNTNTWRGIQNNLTSDSTSDSLAAAQGKALKGMVDGKANTSHTHSKSQITDFPSSMPASDVYSWAKASSKPSYSWSEITGKPSTFTPSSHTHTTINGTYTGNGGQQKPSYVGSGTVRFNMMDNSVNNDGNYKDWILMDTYTGNDVPWVTAFGIDKSSSPRAFIMVGAKGNTEKWASSAELLSTINYTSYTVTKTGSGASGTWGISISGNAATASKASSADSVTWGNVSGKPSSFTPSSHTHSYLPLSGGSLSGNISFSNNTGITALMAGGSDGWGIIGSGTDDAGRLKIYVSDNGTSDWIDFEFRDYTGTTYTPLQMTGNRIIANCTIEGNISGSAGSVAWTNVSGRPSSLPASDVYAWAKASSKPSYSWGEITGKPSSFTPSSHTHSYLPLSGGTVTNNTSFNKDLYVYGETYLNGNNVYINGKTNIQGNGLEIFHSTPYIDFHFNNDSGDQTSRIIELEKGKLNVNGTVCSNDGSLWCTSFSTDGGVNARLESTFSSGTYTDPLPGVTCGIKVSGIATATRFYVKGRSSTWLSGAQPGGAGFECVNDTIDNALIPGWRIRNASGAWVGASYNMDKCFHLYYAKAERLSGNTNNGTDADFIFNANTGNFATKSLTQTSDERRKSVISSSILDTYKDFFMKIKPFSFKWKDGQDDGATHLGVGAQSVFHTALECGFEESDIGLVQRGKEYPGTSIPWSVSYTEFIPLNIAVTQDHETRIEKLEAHASKLERENEELKQQIKELKGLTA